MSRGTASSISVVTPTLERPEEVRGLLECLSLQSALPLEAVLVDGAASTDERTRAVVAELAPRLPFPVVYLRRAGGTAAQRNRGIDAARGELVAFLDDDVRPECDYLERLADVFRADRKGQVGGVVGYRTNLHFRLEERARWRWYRRLRLLSTFVPGAYDRRAGYPINANLQPPFSGTRRVEFMTTACAVWRRAVFDEGLRFDEFFTDYGVLEDAHLALRAGRRWALLQCGDAHCVELHSAPARIGRVAFGRKSVLNYYYVFRDICGPLSPRQKVRFWAFQAFELARLTAVGLLEIRPDCLQEVGGKLHGAALILAGRLARRPAPAPSRPPHP